MVIQILENIGNSNKLRNALYELGLELADKINEPEEESPAIPEGYYFDALNRNVSFNFTFITCEGLIRAKLNIGITFHASV